MPIFSTKQKPVNDEVVSPPEKANEKHIDAKPLSYDIIEVGKIYEYNSSDTTIPVEVISLHKGKIFPKDSSSSFLSFKLKNLLTEKEFNVGIESSALSNLSEESIYYIFKFYPIGTFLKELVQ